MVQHLLLTMVAAPLLVLGAPITLALLAASPAGRRRLSAVLRSGPIPSALRAGRRLGPVLRPCCGALHFSGWYEASLASDGVHVLEHLAYLVTAVLFWMPVVGRYPSPAALSHPARILYLFFAMASMAFLGLALLSANHVLDPDRRDGRGSGEGARGPADRRNPHVGHGTFHIAPALALAMLAWMRADEREALRVDV